MSTRQGIPCSVRDGGRARTSVLNVSYAGSVASDGCADSAERHMRPKTDQVGRAGEYLVAAEILRRGGYAVTFSGNMPGIDILASDADHRRKVTIQVKTRTGGAWQTQITRGHAWDADPQDDRYWILVDLAPDHPDFYVMPAYWIENDILVEHEAYLARSGGTRPRSPRSTHHSIRTPRVVQWRDRWDILGLDLQ